jgi:hypothetical protein
VSASALASAHRAMPDFTFSQWGLPSGYADDYPPCYRAFEPRAEGSLWD